MKPVIALSVVACVLLGRDARSQTATRPLGDQKQRIVELLSELTNDGDDRFLSGQNAGHGNDAPTVSFANNIGRLYARTGKWPYLIGFDYGYDEIADDLGTTNQLLLAHAQRGGLVTVSMHPPNPWHATGSHDTRIGDLRELLNPGTLAYARWRGVLHQVANGLEELKRREIVVLWRPLHEMNGSWFWWGAQENGRQTPPSDFVALWRDMHRYFTKERQLDNLLWVFSAAVQTEQQQPSADYYYPGDTYVDLVGLDWYSDGLDDLDTFGSYSQLTALGKPFGLTEFGPLTRDGTFDNRQIAKAVRTRYNRISFALVWHSWPSASVAIIDNQNANEALAEEQVMTLDDKSR